MYPLGAGLNFENVWNKIKLDKNFVTTLAPSWKIVDSSSEDEDFFDAEDEDNEMMRDKEVLTQGNKAETKLAVLIGKIQTRLVSNPC